MIGSARLIVLGLAAVASAAITVAIVPAGATQSWMTEEAMRAELIGKTVDGHFRQGPTWTLTYSSDGRIDQRYPNRQEKILGSWFFRGSVFCSLPDRMYQPAFVNSCWTVSKSSDNCYEFYRVPVRGQEPSEGGSREPQWYGRAWRQGEPSTCQDRPSV